MEPRDRSQPTLGHPEMSPSTAFGPKSWWPTQCANTNVKSGKVGPVRNLRRFATTTLARVGFGQVVKYKMCQHFVCAQPPGPGATPEAPDDQEWKIFRSPSCDRLELATSARCSVGGRHLHFRTCHASSPAELALAFGAPTADPVNSGVERWAILCANVVSATGTRQKSFLSS